MDRCVYLFFAHIPELSAENSPAADLLEGSSDLRLEQYHDRDETDSDKFGKEPVQKAQVEHFGNQKKCDNQKDSSEQLLGPGLFDEPKQPVQQVGNDNDVDDITFMLIRIPIKLSSILNLSVCFSYLFILLTPRSQHRLHQSEDPFLQELRLSESSRSLCFPDPAS